ncbi:MAG TPA: NAD-dependent epimerase/dehydratase family protein [Aliidongia sp.]|uniref:NAD-dependent epimerase/dehydratase family protein n=1 Tax=Aliidongia sp. TaxID=1914230 RepID=UPI002DDD4525|nr:NAD-dependent epimerase/dehydratase family protein [Aliidongia sp.]HEV2674005.1 NAD-dependent epimerase/dehydratase family protein [Aliidongia sp.]
MKSPVAAFGGAKVLVAGGLGFIGSTLAIRLIELGAEVTVVDSLDPDYGGNFANIAGYETRLGVVVADLRDRERLPELVQGCHYVFNMAAQTGHVDSMRRPVNDLEINAAAPLMLLEAVRADCPEAVVVYGSTRQIYGRPDYLPVDERHPLRPVDVNGVSKQAGEGFHTLYHQVYGLKTAILRLTNTYGPRMRIRDARQTFVGIWLRRVLEGDRFEVWGGTQQRDLAYVDDVVEAALLAAATPAAHGGVFNIGGSPPLSLLDLAQATIAANGGAGGFDLKEFPAERKSIDIGDYWADDGLFRRTVGWAPQVDLATGLRHSVEYYRANLARYL